jgi:hypothetical protein
LKLTMLGISAGGLYQRPQDEEVDKNSKQWYNDD